MPVPAIVVTNPATGAAIHHVDKVGYLRQQRRELRRIAKDPITARMAVNFVTADAQQYFFIDKTKLGTRLSGEPHAMVEEFRKAFVPSDRPSQDFVRKFDDYAPLDLFTIAKLNECLASPNLDGTLGGAIVERIGLRKGLPDRSVVPSIRIFDRHRFHQAIAAHANTITRETIKTRFERIPAHLRGPLAETILQKSNPQAAKGSIRFHDRFAITTATGRSIMAALNSLIANCELELDDLFPVGSRPELVVRSLKALDPRDGNIV